VSIAVFDDRIEIWSTGRLPAGVSTGMLIGRTSRFSGTR
jgi:predicted HTH transcriptional regulator